MVSVVISDIFEDMIVQNEKYDICFFPHFISTTSFHYEVSRKGRYLNALIITQKAHV